MSTTPSLDGYRQAIAIDADALDEGLISQPVLFMEIAEEAAVAMSLRDKAKETLQLVEAELQLVIRDDLEEETGRKPTEAMVSAAIQDHADRKKANNDYMEAKFHYDQWSALKESFTQRGHALRELANLYIAGYYGQNAVVTTSAQAADNKAAKNRRKLAEKRKEMGSEKTRKPRTKRRKSASK